MQTTLGLDEARKAIMAPLSAASIESYTRAYPHLVKLHMLQELADAAFLLQEGSVAGEKDRQRRLKWEERLQVTQSSLAVQVSGARPVFLASFPPCLRRLDAWSCMSTQEMVTSLRHLSVHHCVCCPGSPLGTRLTQAW